MLIPPAMRDCVCFMYAKINGNAKPVGTAFFLALPIRENLVTVIVVTALHVVAKVEEKSDDGKTYLRVNAKQGGFHVVEVGTDQWVKPEQSDEIVDVCYCCWPFAWDGPDFDVRYFSSDIAATKQVMAAQNLGIGNEVAFAGLFVNHHGKKRNEPIVRFGNISAMPSEPISTQHGEIEAYLIESRSVGGLSGSPVFLDPGLFRLSDGDVSRQWRATGEPGGYLLGVMHGHWDAPKEAAQVDANETPEVDYFGISKEYINMGIAVVTPIDKLLKLIDESPLRPAIDAARENPSGPEGGTMVVRLDADMKPVPGGATFLPRGQQPSEASG
jgi:hypothetical protein